MTLVKISYSESAYSIIPYSYVYSTPSLILTEVFRFKKSKIAACADAFPLEALYLVVGGLIVPPKGNAACTAAILDFLSCHHHYICVLNHFRKVFWKVTTLNALGVFF